jgi:hypothetical protein
MTQADSVHSTPPTNAPTAATFPRRIRRRQRRQRRQCRHTRHGCRARRYPDGRARG